MILRSLKIVLFLGTSAALFWPIYADQLKSDGELLDRGNLIIVALIGFLTLALKQVIDLIDEKGKAAAAKKREKELSDKLVGVQNPLGQVTVTAIVRISMTEEEFDFVTAGIKSGIKFKKLVDDEKLSDLSKMLDNFAVVLRIGNLPEAVFPPVAFTPKLTIASYTRPHRALLADFKDIPIGVDESNRNIVFTYEDVADPLTNNPSLTFPDIVGLEVHVDVPSRKLETIPRTFSFDKISFTTSNGLTFNVADKHIRMPAVGLFGTIEIV